MVKKTIKFDIYIKTSEQTPTYSYTAKQKVMSNDKDSTQITFNLLDVAPEELSGSSASILLYMEDGSFFQKSDVTINRNSVIYTMKPEETRHSGNTKVQIVLNKGTVQTASLIYNFEIERGLEKFPIVEKEIQDWTTLTAEAKAFVEQIKDFTLEGFVENKMGEELANLETNYATRLTGLEQKDNQLTAQLAETVKKEDGGSITWAMAAQDFREQITGGNTAVVGVDSVGEINIVNGSVSLDKLDFSKKSSNLYNVETRTEGYYVNNASGGTLTAHSGYQTSDYITVSPSTMYYLRYAVFVAYFDVNKTHISGVTIGDDQTITTPNNAKFMRVSWSKPSVGTQQINLGDTQLSYEPFYEYLDNNYIDKHKINIDDLTITKSVGKNIFDKNNVINNLRLNTTTYGFIDDKLYCISDYINISDYEDLTFDNVVNLIWYNSEKIAISGIISLGLTHKKPDHAKFIRVTILKTFLDRAQIEKGTLKTKYEPYKSVIAKEFLEIDKKDIITTSGVIDGAILSLATQNAYRGIPNAKEPLNIPTYDGSGETVHPSVLYFPEGWNGYKFWMAHTPYPNANNQLENPSIVASNDNVTWVEPAPNPVAPLLPQNNYNSDPCIFMNGDIMEMWFRSSTLNSDGVTWKPTELFRMTTTDGINWTAREKLFDGETFEEVISPTVKFENNKYCMWYVHSVDKSTPVVKYAESVDGHAWETRELNLSIGNGFTFWHGDTIRHDDGRVEMVIMCRHTQKYYAIFYTESLDNINFTKPTLILKNSNPGGWDRRNIYKPAIVLVEDLYYMYYSTADIPIKIGLTKGRSLLSLGLEDNKLADFPELFEVKTLFANRGAFKATDTWDKYPKNAITYFDVWSSVSEGWPLTSGSVKTEIIFNSQDKAVQIFNPPSDNNYYLRRVPTGTGWTGWRKFEGVSM